MFEYSLLSTPRRPSVSHSLHTVENIVQLILSTAVTYRFMLASYVDACEQCKEKSEFWGSGTMELTNLVR